jgi:hypothetical protein
VHYYKRSTCPYRSLGQRVAADQASYKTNRRLLNLSELWHIVLTIKGSCQPTPPKGCRAPLVWRDVPWRVAQTALRLICPSALNGSHSHERQVADCSTVLEFQNNNWAAFAIGTSCEHSWSSFSARLTRVLTGYFFINLGSNGLRVSTTSAASVTPGSNHRS